MPTIAVFGRVRLRMYADDHRPPHFHLESPDGNALVAIASFELLAGDLRRSSARH